MSSRNAPNGMKVPLFLIKVYKKLTLGTQEEINVMEWHFLNIITINLWLLVGMSLKESVMVIKLSITNQLSQILRVVLMVTHNIILVYMLISVLEQCDVEI